MNEIERGGLGWKKSLYVFLTAILGIVLFLTLQRALTLLYFVLLSYNYGIFSSGLPFMQYAVLSYVTLLLAVFLGGWYGVWLGLHWYEIVYEKNPGHKWFGLSGKLFDHSQNMPVKKVSPLPRPSPSIFKPAPVSSPPAPDTKTYKLADLRKDDNNWLDDLQKPSPPSVAVVSKSKNGSKPRPARKTASKKPANKAVNPKANIT